MPDTYLSGGSSKVATRAQVESEWADIRPSLDKVAVQAQALIASLRDIPRPLFADERRKADRARVAFAEQVSDGLRDLILDLIGPVSRRADDAGIDTDTIMIDLTDLLREYAALEREASQTCVTGKQT